MAKPTPQSVTTDGEITRWKTPYNHDTDAEARRTATVNNDKSKTQQHFKEEQDINKIVARVLKTGTMPDIPVPPMYADLATQEDYHTMLNRIAETNGLFYRLDPELRAEYKNDPGAWLQDVNERLEKGDLVPLRQMGLDLSSVDAQIAAREAELKVAQEAPTPKGDQKGEEAPKGAQAAPGAAKT